MKAVRGRHLLGIFLLFFWIKFSAAQEEPLCVENSPERRGEIGCSIVSNKKLPPGLKESLVWHIERFEKVHRPARAVDPAGIAFEAHGAWWAMSVESKADAHHEGDNITHVDLLPLPKADEYSMLVISAYIPSGMTSRVIYIPGLKHFT